MLFTWPRLAGDLSLGSALAPAPIHGYECLVFCDSAVCISDAVWPYRVLVAIV